MSAMKLDEKALNASCEAYDKEWLATELHSKATAAAIRTYLEAATPPDVAGLLERLDNAATDWRDLKDSENADLLTEAATALRLSAGGGVPEGWKLVPVEPTEEMIGEGDRVMYGRYGCSFEVAPIYDAMLDASPTVEAGHVE